MQPYRVSHPLRRKEEAEAFTSHMWGTPWHPSGSYLWRAQGTHAWWGKGGLGWLHLRNESWMSCGHQDPGNYIREKGLLFRTLAPRGVPRARAIPQECQSTVEPLLSPAPAPRERPRRCRVVHLAWPPHPASSLRPGEDSTTAGSQLTADLSGSRFIFNQRASFDFLQDWASSIAA